MTNYEVSTISPPYAAIKEEKKRGFETQAFE
jgi:hypothetical protein